MIFLVLACIFSASASMAQTQTFPDHMLKIYEPSDPLLDLKLKFEMAMGVYLTHPPRRHKSEKVSLRRDQILVDVWQSVYGLTDGELKCRALKWLINGRTQYVNGGRGILSDQNQYNRVTLRFHVVEHKKNSRRVRKGREKIVRYLEATLSRNQLEQLSMKNFSDMLDSGECEAYFRRKFKGKFSSRYTKKRRKSR